MKKALQRLHKTSPGMLLLIYYLGAILLGACALSLPAAAVGEPLTFIDALFTSTSAQCVTGLAVVDTGTRLSLFGQLVLLLLIQTGGLGITTFSVYLFFYLHIGVGTRGRWIIHDTLLHTPVDSVRDLVRGVILMTLVIEGIGALLLSISFVPRLGWGPGLYSASFHSISAFCNAGFSLFPDSLVGFRDDPLVNLTIMLLIVFGGIGFLVLRELKDLIFNRRRQRRRLSLHSKMVLLTSAILILGGALVIALMESTVSLRNSSAGEVFWISLFQSVSARTAGFNTIDLSRFEVPTLFLLMFLMFIGASPGSCGGGIKTTSLAIFIAIMLSRLRGNAHTNLFRRTIPEEVTSKTLTLVMLALLFMAAAIFALLAVQLQGIGLGESGNDFMGYTFEAVSAFATVGLSVGATVKLVPLGKLIVIMLMFVGRVGLLTVAFAFIKRSSADAVQYGEESLMIG
ncbi:MAG: potassium transporter [Desulfuromonadaceae bacterium GWC2_58_13]|nr:MAG: potassium transporter [Desulfuromonadaceae bacterium GWC2_58_13]